MVYFLNGEAIILTNTDTIQFIGGEVAPILGDYVPPSPPSTDSEKVFIFM
jgi:hypothetical protein